MVRTHPQWHGVRELIADGRIGDLRADRRPFQLLPPRSERRSQPRRLGRRCAARHRLLSDHALALAVRRGTGSRDRPDRARSRHAGRPAGVGAAALSQRAGDVHLRGTARAVSANAHLRHDGAHRGRDSVQLAADRPARIWSTTAASSPAAAPKSIEFPAVDQYTLQADRFADAVRGVGTVPVSLEDSIANMAVIDALFRSAETGQWETPS